MTEWKPGPGKSSEVLIVDPAGITTNFDLLASTVRRGDMTWRWMVWFMRNTSVIRNDLLVRCCTEDNGTEEFIGFEIPVSHRPGYAPLKADRYPLTRSIASRISASLPAHSCQQRKPLACPPLNAK
jgi:hypothetical protein